MGSRRWPDGVVAFRYGFRHALYQRTLYERLSPARRAALHEEIGRRLETAYGGRVSEAAAELARHFQGTRDPGRALVYLEQAANHAYERRAYADVIASLGPALQLLENLPDTLARRRLELQLRQLYASVQSQTGGYTTAGLVENLERMRGLCAQLGEISVLFDTLCTLYLLQTNGGEVSVAESLEAELSRLAGRLGPPAALHYDFLRGAAVVWLGSLTDAGAFLSRALSSPVSLEEAHRPFGVNPVVGARSLEGLRQWTTGDVAAAYSVQKEALLLAERSGRPFTLAQALTFSAFVLLLEREWAEAGKRAARVLALADEYGFPRWRGRGLIVHGCVLVEEGDAARGLAEIREGLDRLSRSGLRLGHSLHLSLYADACLRAGRLDEGLTAVAAGLAHCQETSERIFEPELWRLRGEILARRGRSGGQSRAAKAADAQACFEKARALARAHGAPMLERRVAGRPAAVARRASR
jgi:adenylate cyclase